MTEIKDITELSMEYLKAHNRMNERFKKWKETKFEIVYNTLNMIYTELIEKNEFFAENLHITNKDEISIVYLNMGEIIIPNWENILIKNSENPVEKGFLIGFNQLNNGVIRVYCHKHFTNEILTGDGERIIELALINNLDEITENRIIELTYQGMEKAMKSSYLFLGYE